MATDRWNKMQELFEAALLLDESRQEEFIKDRCQGDLALYDEVMSLLESDSKPHPLLNGSALDALDLRDETSLEGKQINQYRILERIGSGGMGDVFLALDQKLERKVALKFLPSLTSGDDKQKTRFLQEARLAAGLNHPNIVIIHEIFEYDRRPCIVMEYVDGQSLRQLITSGRSSIDEALSFVEQVCDGLAAAHRAHIIHRDIKPENILLTKDRRVKILDFGVARVAHLGRITKAGLAIGTPDYMSPEQAQGQDVDSRSDIFSTGILLYELVTGQAPFRRDNLAATINAIVSEPPKPLAALKINVPIGLQEIVDKSLAKAKGNRYRRIDELVLTCIDSF